MLKPVQSAPKHFHSYRPFVDPKLFRQVQVLAEKLKGKRVLHINSNAKSGGIAQTLHNLVPLMKSLGIKAEWQVVEKVPDQLYNITKFIHNGLQGAKPLLSRRRWQIYENFNRELAQHIDGNKWDYIFIHDSQPAGVLSWTKNRGTAKWLWRCHIDTEKPNPSYHKRFIQYVNCYDGAIFTLPNFIFKNLKVKRVLAAPMAIDPLAPKNELMDKSTAMRIVSKFGIDITRPFITQVSRIDPWKDHIGVVKAFRLAKKQIPELQLVFVASVRKSDQQGQKILVQIMKATVGLKDFHLLVNQVSERETKAFVVANNIALQKSTREGFGLTVSEALWQKTPVIGGNVGGIRPQIISGKTGYLVNSPKECARRIVELIKNPAKARAFGRHGHQYVRKHFLMPRLIRDELKFMLQIK